MKTWYCLEGCNGRFEYIGQAENFEDADELCRAMDYDSVWIFDREDLARASRKIIALLAEVQPADED